MRGFAGAVARNLNDPQVPISASTIAELFPGASRTMAGTRVTETRLFGTTAWYRGVSLMAGTMAGLPIDVRRYRDREVVTQQTVLNNPNPANTPFEFWQTVIANAVCWGQGYALKERDGADIVRRAWPIHPSRVRHRPGDRTSANPSGKLFDVTNPDGTMVTLTPWELAHFPYLSVNGVTGIPALTTLRETLGINIAAEDTAAKFYGNGTRISGILTSKQKLDNDKADRLKERWRIKVAGADNAGEIAVLDSDTTFQPIALPPQDAQLLESRRFGVIEVARLLGIPPHLLMDVEKSTSWGTGIEQQTLAFVKFTLKPWLDMLEQRITREFLPGGWSAGSWYAEYNLEGLLRGDAAARAAYYHSGITDGWLRRSEARGAEGFAPSGDDTLDEFLVPSNLTLVQVDGQMVPLSAAGTSTPAEEAQ